MSFRQTPLPVTAFSRLILKPKPRGFGAIHFQNSNGGKAMKNYYASDFALNTTNEETIVYRSVDGTIEMVTKDDYIESVIHSKIEVKLDFSAMKDWSDNDYETQDVNDNRQTRKNISLHCLDATETCAVPSPEEEFFVRSERAAKERRRRKKERLVKRALASLTEVQRRRYLLHMADGLSTWQIAEIEGKNQKTIHESLSAAEKKVNEFLAEGK